MIDFSRIIKMYLKKIIIPSLYQKSINPKYNKYG